jgi:hypothetical protein
MRKPLSLRPLVAATLANYAAQIPYFLHNYYTPQHPLPNLRAVALLGGTLIWFLSGLGGFRAGKSWGSFALLSFLTVEALFYAKTLVTGAMVYQLQNPSDLIRAVFVAGYISGALAAIYVFLLARGGGHGSSPTAARVTSDGLDTPADIDDARDTPGKEEARGNDSIGAALPVSG